MLSYRSGIALCVIVAAASGASAAPLNLTLGLPDAASLFLNANYNAASDQLSVTGPALSLEVNGVGGPDYSISGGSLSILATIDGAGVLQPGGTLTIAGSIAALSAGSPLITASLTDFGFSGAPLTQIFEFRASVTGGSIGGMFGSQIGVILNLGGGFAGSFANNFANSGTGTADTASIPAPGALATLAGLGVLGARRRRR